MDAQRASFVDGAAKNKASQDAQRREIFDLVDKFAGYGFNKCHAARLRAGRLPDGLAEGEPSGRVLRRLDDPRHRQHRQARQSSAGSWSACRSRCCRPTSTSRWPSSPSRRTDDGKSASATRWRAIKGVGREAMNRLAEERAGQGAVQGPVRLRRAARPARDQQAPAREPGEGRRLRFAEQEPRPDLRRGRGAERAIRRPRTSSAAATRTACSATTRRSAGRRCPRCRTGRRWSGCRTSSPRSASTSPPIRSTPTSAACSGCGVTPRRRPAGAADARRARPHQARRHRDRPPGAHLGQGQPLRLRAVLGPVRRLRAHRVQRALGQQAQSPGAGPGGRWSRPTAGSTASR